ncbi:MAG: DUF1552 domain-containing protein [Lentisphaeraceae bacterium]|nr:DUF1552 domain-containing protein [Lentisphaeraceae bacterium]
MKNRRQFLKSSAAFIALPFLESFSATPILKEAPKRVIFLGMGFGVTSRGWYPKQDDTGYDYTLQQSFAPIAKHKKDFTIFQNLEHANSRDGHAGSTFWLTGADRHAMPGQSFHNTISVDQVAAAQFGRHTRYNSIVLRGAGSTAHTGHGTGSISWNLQGKPIIGMPNPVSMYHKLFSSEKMSVEERQTLLRDDRSALDSVLLDAKAMKKVVSKADKDKIDEYFQSIRELETRISKDEDWINIPKKQPSKTINEPSKSLAGESEIEAAYDLMLAGMEVDACRVYSYQMPGDTLLSSLGSSFDTHAISHHNGSNDERTRDSLKRDEAHLRLISGFIDKMKATKDVDGRTIFDNTTLVFGSNLRQTHSLNNCPTFVTGGGSGFKHGRHIVMDKKTPLCNLWQSILQGSGVKTGRFGDSTGVIKEIFKA